MITKIFLEEELQKNYLSDSINNSLYPIDQPRIPGAI